MAFFDDCKSIEELEARKKLWAKRLHPDAGGVHATFTSMMQEYEEVSDRISGRSSPLRTSDDACPAEQHPVVESGDHAGHHAPTLKLQDVLAGVQIGAEIVVQVVRAARSIHKSFTDPIRQTDSLRRSTTVK